MEIIVLTKSGGAGRSVCLVPAALRLTAVLALLAAGALVWAGFQLRALPAPGPGAAGESPALAAELRAQRRLVEIAREDAEANLDALALQLAKVEARMIRLDAVGRRLVEQAGLSLDEFGFGEEEPALGGPAPRQEVRQSVPDFLGELEAVARRLEDREQTLRALDSLLVERKVRAAARPAGRPVREGWLSSYYGTRTDPFTGRKGFHDGIDFAGPRGTDVVAVAAGVVTASGTRSGYGRMVEIAHGDGLATRYAHNSENLVEVGDRVAKGDTIARMGESGRATGPHVHFEVLREGRTVNPLKFVKSGS